MNHLTLKIKEAKANPNKEVKLCDNCYFVFDGLTLYKIQSDDDWNDIWTVTNFESDSKGRKFYDLEKALKSAKWF
jgi:hypothetical protein